MDWVKQFSAVTHRVACVYVCRTPLGITRTMIMFFWAAASTVQDP